MQVTTRRPTHPGQIIKSHYMTPLDLSITALAERLSVSRKTISAIVNERAAVSTDMALRLARAFSTTPDLWLNLQRKIDLWEAQQGVQPWQSIEPFEMTTHAE